jgi:predicted HicB family RNase H-like nuclease
VSAADTVPLNVRLPRDLHARLKLRALLRGRTIRQYVTEAIEEAVERDETQDRRGND